MKQVDQLQDLSYLTFFLSIYKILYGSMKQQKIQKNNLFIKVDFTCN